MANYANLKAAIDTVIKANGQQEITGTVLNQTLTAMVNSLGAGYLFMGVAIPSTNPGTPDQNVFYLAGQAGTYSNFGATTLQAGLSILKWNGTWSSETLFTFDASITQNSANPITSGAVFEKLKLDGGAYDVSAHNNNQTFASLSALLNDANLSTLIPTNIRSGGMSIKYVQTSDNKYVQFRYMGTDVTGNPNPFLKIGNWQGVDDEPTANSENLVKSGGVDKYITLLKNSSLGISSFSDGVTKNSILKIDGSKSYYGGASYVTTNKIGILQGSKKLLYSGKYGDYQTVAVVFYDENNNIVSTFPSESGGTIVKANNIIIDIPNTAVSFDAGSTYNTFFVQVLSANEANIVESINNNIDVTEDNRNKITNVLDILFSISDEIKSAKIVNNRYVRFNGTQVIDIDTYSGYSILSIPIVEGVDYKFKYQTTGECSWYVTNSDYSTPSTIVAGRNGDALVNTTIIDETEHIASFTAPVSGLFNINFNLGNYHLIDVYFTKLSDNNKYKVLGIPQSIVEDLDSLEQALQSLSGEIESFITGVDNIFDVNLKSTGYNFSLSTGYIGGISENKSNPAGLLTRLKSNATVTAGTRHIRVYKKVRNSSSAVTGITTVATYEITSDIDWSELDVSSLNIQVPADCAVAIEKLNADDNPAKYSFSPVSEADAQRLIIGGVVYYNGYCGGFTFAVRQRVLDISSNPAIISLQDDVNQQEEQIGKWSSLNVRIMGDSITNLGGDNCDQNNGWTKWFKEKANPLTCKSYARSGATLTNLETTEYNIVENTGNITKDNVFYNQINRLIDAYDNEQDVAPDVLIVALGTNDFGRPRVPNAETVFTTNTSSYTTSESVQTMLSIAQALRYGVEMLYQKFPDVQIMFLTPQQSTWNTIENREGVGNEIEQSCRYLGIPCLRLDYEAATWFIRENVSYYKTYDGTHTSAIGAKRNGYLIEKWARNKLQY